MNTPNLQGRKRRTLKGNAVAWPSLVLAAIVLNGCGSTREIRSAAPLLSSICDISSREAEYSTRTVRVTALYSPWWENNILTSKDCRGTVYDIYIDHATTDVVTKTFVREYEATWEQRLIEYSIEFEGVFLNGADRGNFLSGSGRGVFKVTRVLSYKKLREL